MTTPSGRHVNCPQRTTDGPDRRGSAMKSEQIDYIVVGFSLAGIAAALTLAEEGSEVALLDYDRDTATIADSPRIQETPLGPPATGVAFEEGMRLALQQAGVAYDSASHVTGIYSDGGAIVECSGRRWSPKGVVFAPNGTEPGPELDGSSALEGFGVSYSAAADAPFFVGRRVAVYGDSPQVIEQAAVAAQYAANVRILIKENTAGGDTDLLSHLVVSPAVTFEHPVMLRGLRASSEHMLNDIEVEGLGGRRWIEVAALSWRSTSFRGWMSYATRIRRMPSSLRGWRRAWTIGNMLRSYTTAPGPRDHFWRCSSEIGAHAGLAADRYATLCDILLVAVCAFARADSDQGVQRAADIIAASQGTGKRRQVRWGGSAARPGRRIDLLLRSPCRPLPQRLPVAGLKRCGMPGAMKPWTS
jgi:thioredoxin reductase